LAARGVILSDVADSLNAWWRDTSGGSLKTQGGAWSIRIQGITTDPQALAELPIFSSVRPGLSVRLGDVARIESARAPATQLAATEGRPAISMAVTKKSGINTLTLVSDLNAYIERQNTTLLSQGLELRLTDDQTIPTSEAIGVMQTNALYGALLVLAVCWVFLGSAPLPCFRRWITRSTFRCCLAW
jgi:multidrug efflux pump subunit AcrB